MQEDIEALKKGQAPAGFQIEKQSEKEIKPASPSIPQPPASAQIFPHVELGRLEKSRPLAGITPPLPPMKAPAPAPTIGPSQPGPTKPSISIPSVAGFLGRLGGPGSRKLLLGGIGSAVVIVLVVMFVFLRTPSKPEVTFSPTPLITTTATPPATPFIESAFNLYSSVNLGVGSDVFGQLLSSVNKEVLAGGEPGLYKIVDPQAGQHYSFDSFMSSALVTIPEEVKTFIDKDGVYLSLMQKAVGGYSYGFAVKVTIADYESLRPDPALAVLSRWETNISSNIKVLFALDIDRAASVDFLDNAYQNVAIRYRNFPDPLKTIDYAVITAANGDKYLVFTNSREHIYAIIDNLK